MVTVAVLRNNRYARPLHSGPQRSTNNHEHTYQVIHLFLVMDFANSPPVSPANFGSIERSSAEQISVSFKNYGSNGRPQETPIRIVTVYNSPSSPKG